MRFIILITSLITIIFGGCDDNQSPNAKFVDAIAVGLWFDPDDPYYPTEHAWQLDKWSVDAGDEGQDICNGTFAFLYQATMDMAGVATPVQGVRVDLYLQHTDPTGGDYDIWDKVAPNGEKYGFVQGFPAVAMYWNQEEGHAASRTDMNGFVVFAVGLGGPDYELDYGWKWPGGCSNMISTAVKLTAVIRRINGNIIKESHCYFLRGQCGGFWWPSGHGVFDVSYSSTAPAPEFWGLSAMGITIDGVEGDVMKPAAPNLIEISERSGAPNSYPIVGELESVAGIPEDIGYWYFERIGWGTLTWDSFWKQWYWAVEETALKSLPSPGPDPNDAVEMLSMCHPHAFICELFIERPQDYNAVAHTLIATSKDADGNDVSWFPIRMFPYIIGGYTVFVMTEYLVPIDSPVGEGRYYDWWGFPGTLIYVPEGGYLEVDFDSFYGDFNFDNLVDFKDFGWLMNHWRQDMVDFGYDLQLDANQDLRTDVNDLTEFMKNWLEIRP